MLRILIPQVKDHKFSCASTLYSQVKVIAVYCTQACQKVLKVGGATALELAKGWGARRRAMYLNLETLGGL